ncbi:recombinase family protein [Anaeromyxobacter diazotrophicus]|uniref:recombinase family protein n=1 Tax=Anaeromyxobacter diazotrophicus TaxID=2590199 RepID=UPI00159203CF|nr:recombinase family protein [Anaeromyxobacter diazotrophicus]
MRYVEVIRVSGQTQYDKDTPAQQRAALDRLAQGRAGVCVATLQEPRAVSGALRLAERPDLQKLLQLARERAFDELRVQRWDRVQRTPLRAERGLIIDAIAEAGAKVVEADGGEFDPATDDGDLMLGLKGSMANRERNLIRARTTAGKLQAARAGRPYRAAYGRTWDVEKGTWGYDEEKRAVYKSLFDRVLAGESQRSIARDLNARGIPTPGGVKWSAGHTSRLLKDASAYGVMTREGIEIQCPPIVDRETWEKAQVALTEHSTRLGGPPRKSGAILQKLVKCAVCGGPVHVRWTKDSARKGRKSRLYYVCARRPEPACRRFHAVPKVDELVEERIIAMFADPKNQRFIFDEEGREQGEPIDYESEKLSCEKRMGELRAKAERIQRRNDAQLLEDETADKMLAEVAKERREVESRLAQASLSVEQREARARAEKVRFADVRRSARFLRRRKGADPEAWRKTLELLLQGQPLYLRPDGTVTARRP